MKSAIPFVFLVLFPLISHATAIRGKVVSRYDSTGIPGVQIILKNTAFKSISDKNGRFILENIPAGNYSMHIRYQDYNDFDTLISIGSADSDKTIFLKITLNPGVKQISTVIINGIKDKGSVAFGQAEEKNSNNIESVLSSQAIEKSPDVTVANALQRISGVSLSPSQEGENRYAILRGMNQRYNNTLIDGLEITSPDPKARYVPLDLIPSDMLERIEVIKTLTPDMEANAIGGSVNMVMKEAPDSMILDANVYSSYNDESVKNGFTTIDAGTIQKEDPLETHPPGYVPQPWDFTRNNLKFTNMPFPLGYAANVSFGERFFKNKFGFISNLSYQNFYKNSDGVFYNTTVNAANQSEYYTASQRNYSTQFDRFGMNNKFDYKPDDNNRFVLTAILFHTDEQDYRRSIDTSLDQARTGPGTGFITYKERSQLQIEDLANVSLQGYHDFLDKLVSIDWTALYSSAYNQVPDQAEIATDFTQAENGNRTPPILDDITRIWQHNQDRDYSGILNITYRPTLFGKLIEVKAGTLYREKQRNNYYSSYTITAALDPVTNLRPVYKGIDSVNFVIAPDGLNNANNFTATEDIFAWYGQAKVEFGSLQVLTGLRVENTVQDFTTLAPNTYAYKTYSDILPGIHLKYTIDENQALRLSGYKSISRPDYYELVPYHIEGEYYDEYGNPYLNRTQASNYDLRYEYFGTQFAHLGAGVFYKDIMDPIEYELNVSNPKSPFIEPYNLGHAHNYGFEISGVKYFGNFGIAGNYTYTHSEVTISKIMNDSVQKKVLTVNETLPLQGQSPHIANLSLIYLNVPKGIDAQLSFVFTGSRLEQLSPYYGQDYYTKDYYTLDFSAQKRINKHFTIFTKITNLLNDPYEIAIKNSLLVEKNYFGRFYKLGLRYRLN